jgi:hypothetical protein
MGSKNKAKDEEITKKKEDKEKEFAGKDMTVDGEKSDAGSQKSEGENEEAFPSELETPNSELTPDKPLTISDMLPGLRAKGMRI